MSELWSALCLVAILEGLVLFAIPAGWKRAALQLLQMSDGQVRAVGGFILIFGLTQLWAVKHCTAPPAQGSPRPPKPG